MNVRRIVLGVVLVALAVTPGLALAQGPGPGMGMHGGMGSDSGSTKEIQGMMQQMGGMMEHMADRIQAGPMTPEQTKQMSEVMRHIADMINNSYGMRGAETPQQILNMMERMTEMHKRLMAVMASSK